MELSEIITIACYIAIAAAHYVILFIDRKKHRVELQHTKEIEYARGQEIMALYWNQIINDDYTPIIKDPEAMTPIEAVYELWMAEKDENYERCQLIKDACNA